MLFNIASSCLFCFLGRGLGNWVRREISSLLVVGDWVHTQVCLLGWNYVPCYVTDLENVILWVGRACAPPQPTPQCLGLT